jgi:ABC-type bacteriocin/lantibiotic exporter with double-glycine peptidase domain
MNKRRTPVVLQLNAVECGPACLAMILGYYGRKVRLEECRSKCDPGRDGVSAQTISAAAHDFGLRTRGLSLQHSDFDRVQLPCIAHWKNNHFVVVEHWSRERVTLVDPAWGRRQLSIAEFAAGFSGVVLQFAPVPDFSARTSAVNCVLRNGLRHIWRAAGTTRLLIQIVAATLLLQAFGFALPLLTKWIVDRVLPLKAAGEMKIVGVGAVVVALATSTVGYLRSALLIRLERNLDSHLMLGFFQHLLSLPYRFFQQRNSGDLLMRLASNSTIREALASYTTSAILDGSLVIIFVIALFRVSPVFALAASAIAVLEGAVLFATAPHLRCLVESDVACQSASQSCLIESLAGITTLKASGAERAIFTRWSRLLVKQVDASARRSSYMAKVEAVMTMLRTFSPVFLLWLGGTMVMKGSVSLGTMLAINALAAAFLQPVASLVVSGQRLQLARAHLERIADVMQAQPEQDSHSAGSAPPISGRIELRDVSFRFDSHSPTVLHNVSLDIHPGQKVALVGRTGSGKSTLAKLLLGLYTPTGGEILYDGVRMQAMNLQSLRRSWGAVLQDASLFSLSLRDNIAFHDPALPESDLVRAARIAEIHEEILQMPMQYETRIDEGGVSLSGGQRQRLAIARAVAKRPRLLLLDEATSHLDALTEAAVDRNLDALTCTRVVIAHRLSAIQNADCIVVLDQGRIVETGTHRELLTLGGHYATLVFRQYGVNAPTSSLSGHFSGVPGWSGELANDTVEAAFLG